MEQSETKMPDQETSPGMANTAVAFIVALVAFSGMFFLLDYAVMAAQGLTLFFHG